MLSKEVKTYNYGKDILKDLKDIYRNGEIVSEYEKLLTDYKSLVNRYEKILRISDKFEIDIFKKNNDLKDSLDYTIKKAKSKILDNVTEHRKTKVAKSLYREKNLILETELDILVHQNKFLKEKLEYYITTYGDVDITITKKEILEYLLNFSLNENKYLKTNIDDFLEKNLSKENKYILCKLGIVNFYEITQSLKSVEDIENFLRYVLKYIQNTFHSDDIIFHHQYDEFYILIKNRTIENLRHIYGNLNSKRDISGLKLNFVCGVVVVQEDNEIKKILELCNKVYIDASKLEEKIKVL